MLRINWASSSSFSLSGKLFATMVHQTIFSVSTSEDKHVLTGVLFEFGKGGKGEESNFRMVATDGYRLAKVGAEVEMKGEIKTNIIIPAKALQEVARIIEQDKEDTNLEINFGKISDLDVAGAEQWPNEMN